MKKIMFIIALGAVTLNVQAEEFLYILSAQAKLLEQPSFGSTEVAHLTKGQKVVELEKNNHWFKVQFQDSVGWLSRLAVSPNPPSKRTSLLADASENLVDNARMRASTAATTAAVRGLRADERARVTDKMSGQNFEAVANMEATQFSDSDVKTFLSQLQ